jgi:hypothetical protein
MDDGSTTTYFRDSPLHDEEVGIVDVKLHALEERLYRVLL